MNRNRSAAGFNSAQVRAVITLCDIDHCILREVVNAFFGFDAQIFILLIQITGDRISNNGIILGRILIEALTRCLRAGCIGGEADIASLERFGGSGQSFSNLDRTSQLAVIRGVEELLCQLVQNFIDRILVFSLIISVKAFRDALVIRDERDIGAGISLTDGKATAENIGRMISIMAVNHSGIAAVITYADVACIACHKDAAFITGEGSQLAGAIYIPDRIIQLQVHRIAIAVTGPGGMIQIRVYGIAGKVIAGPGCATSHVKVHDTCTTAFSIAYIALPEGILRIQTEADICIGTGIIHVAAEINIAFQLYIFITCTDDSSFGILLDIHIHLSAVLGNGFTISSNRIFSSVDRLDDAAADLNLGGNCTDGFVGAGSITLISHNINEAVHGNTGHHAAYAVHALDHGSICRSRALRAQGKYIISTGIVNINRSSGIHEQCACLTTLGACSTDRHRTGIIDVDYTLADGCDTGCMGIRCCIYRQLVAIHIHGHIMGFVRAGNSCANLRNIRTTCNQMLFRCDGCAVCREYIGAIVLQYAFFYVNRISSCITGNCRSKFFSYLAARLAGLISIVALARCKGACIFRREGNIAGLQCCGRSCQAFSNLHYAREMTIRIVLVEQLACQVIQYVSYFILSISGIALCKAGGNALIICDKGDSRAFCCIGNIEAAANHLGRISSIMIIEYSGMTAVIDNRNRMVILLVNQACICYILATMQCCQRAACPYRIFRRYGRSCHMRLLFVSPGCTVLQIQVELADIMHGIAAAAIVIIILVIGCNALPEGIFIRQGHIENACIIPVNQLAAAVFHNLLAILAGCIHITGNLGGRIAC